MKRSMIVDISNILFRVAAMQKTKSPSQWQPTTDELVGMSMHVSLMSIHKWYNKYKPDFLVFAFEGGNNWRKTYTADNNCRRQYKANRVADPEMKHFYILLESFQEIMTKHTSICCLTIPDMEADDAIAGYCQVNASDEHEVIIISGDKDFIQLLKLPNVKLVNPDNGKLRNQPDDKEYQSDIDYWLFLKCIRGDSGDNVPSAYPRVRETKIKEVYDDPFKRLNFLNETWVDENKVKHRVGDLINHNEVLMNLEKQPTELRIKLIEGIEEQSKTLGTYSHFHFLKFLGSFNLKKVGEESSKFINMFTNNQRYLKGERQVRSEEVVKVPTDFKPMKTEVKTKLLNF